MALDLDCKTTEYYTGNGEQTEFTFYFQLIDPTDLKVGIYNTTTNEYDETTAWTRLESTPIVRFDAAPSDGEQFIIYRLTDIDSMRAIFHPGHAVKAGDLNDNFEQLQFAVEDTRCFIESGTADLRTAIDSVAVEATVFLGPNPPANPVEGTLWWSTLEGNLFIRYNDVDSQQWVDASPAFVELSYERIENYIDSVVATSGVNSITSGNNITITSTQPNGKGDVTINADLSSLVQDQQRQDENTERLEKTIVDLADRLEQLEDIVAGINYINGGYPNAKGVFDQSDTNGGAADPASQTNSDIDGGDSEGYD